MTVTNDRETGERAGREAAYQPYTLGELLARVAGVCETFAGDPAYAVGFIAGVADVFDAMTDADVTDDVRPPRDGALA